jgi:diguanylate cyclase (GGDEF)-like protein
MDESGQIKGYVGTITDISSHKQAELKLQHNAFHDSLTNLPNRALLIERLEQALQRQQRHPERLFGVLFLDLDRFKVINDSLGHLVGDQLLIALAKRLQQCKRASDTVARLGGDEFVLLLEELTSIESAIKVAERLHQALEKPFLLKHKELFVSASIGIALSSPPNYYLEATQLLRDADTAMYQAKGRGKSCSAVFEPSMHTQAQKLLQLENDLRRAISRQELVIYYQPIFCLETNCLEGVEALVRWQHPEQGLIAPADFIPMAEETGIIVALDRWVLENACCQLRYWRQQFPAFSDLTLSVNLSGNHFSQRDCLEQIDQILASTGILGQDLKLEITESVLLCNSDSTAEILKQLRKRKIQVCLDDFGTGYSSLSYLHRFPINTLKIDRSFISTPKTEQLRKAIVRTIVTLGHELGIEVIAEGIETAQQIQLLKALGCHYGQGYYFSPPVDDKTLTAEVLSCYT